MRMSMRVLALQEVLDRQGFLMVDVLDRATTARTLDMVNELFVGPRSGFHTSALSIDHGYRRRLREQLAPVFEPAIERYFEGYKIVHVAILGKFPGAESAMGAHQDWTMVDETEFRSLNLWCPLTDVDRSNGALAVLPGSHRVLRHVRSSPCPPDFYDDPIGRIEDSSLQVVPMGAGQGLVTDHGLVHCSGANNSAHARMAVAIGLAPIEAPLYHYFCHPDDRTERFQIPEPDWFLTFDMGNRPVGVRSDGFVAFNSDDMSGAELLRRSALVSNPPTRWSCAGGAVRRRLGRPKIAIGSPVFPPVIGPVPEGDSDSFARSGPMRSQLASPGSVETTFRDPGLQARFVRDGALVIDLLSTSEVALLRAAYLGLDNPVTVDGPLADGFHTTIYDDRLSYRREVFELIEAAFSAALERIFNDHRVFFANFLVKGAGGAAIPPHLDWTFLDENRFSSVTVWCPLEATTRHNGTLGVVQGSHHRVDFIRAVNYRDSELHAAVAGQPSVERYLDLGPGQAVVLNNRTLHFSTPNESGERRLVAACVAAPRSADLHHYWVDEQQQLLRLDVDQKFYLEYQVGVDPRRVRGVRGERSVPMAMFG